MESCVNYTPRAAGEQENLEVTLSGVISQVVLPAVCVFGIVGNMLNLAILTRRKLQKSFRTLEQAANFCLIFLALSDLMFCIFAFLTMFLPIDNIYEDRGILLNYAVYSVAIINTFIMESTMLTVAMSLERYLAICFPLRQDIYLTTHRIKFIIAFTFLFSISFNIPVLWRNKIISLCANMQDDVISNRNITCDNLSSPVANINGSTKLLQNAEIVTAAPKTTLSMIKAVFNISVCRDTNCPRRNNSLIFSSTPLSSTNHSFVNALSQIPHAPVSLSPMPGLSLLKTDCPSTDIRILYTTRIVPLGGSHVYDITYRIVWAFVGNFIPLLLLFYFNVCLCRKIYRSYKLRRHLGRQTQTKSSSHILTITLVAIVVLFFILVAPSEVTLQISYLTSSHDTPMYKNIEAVLNLMQSINFSVNFILYCIISPYFRRTLKYMMLCGCYRFYQVSKHWKKEFETSLL